MIYGIFICICGAFLLVLDYAHIFVEKRRKVSFYIECLIWSATLVFFWNGLFTNGSLYADGGVRVDILTILLLSREAILARIRQSENSQAITESIRKQSMAVIVPVPQISTADIEIKKNVSSSSIPRKLIASESSPTI